MKFFRKLASSPATTVSALTAATFFVIASGLSAHDTWLFPRKTTVSVGSRLTLDLTSGMAFSKNETAIEPARIAQASVRLAGRTDPMTIKVKARKSLELTARFNHTGLATLWLTLNPRPIDLKPEQVHEYLEEIGAPDSIRALYANKQSAPRWREVYTKHAKTFVTVGSSKGDSSWKIPVGQGLELVPLVNPATIAAGDIVPIQVLRDGTPYPGFSIGDVADRQPSSRLYRTDANGVASVAAPRRGGRWMLRGTDLRRPRAGSDADWESAFSTLTLNVWSKPGRKAQ